MRLRALHFALAPLAATGVLLAVPGLQPAAASPSSSGDGRLRSVLEGRVAGLGGAPLAGVVVRLVGAPADGTAPTSPLAATVTGEDGGYRLQVPAVARPDGWRMRLEAPGRVSLDLALGSLEGDRRLPPARLQRDLGQSIRVVDVAGRPLPGATVEAVPANESAEGWRAATFRGETGEEGRLTVPWDGGRWTVRSVAPEEARSAPVSLPAAGGRRAVVELVAGRVPYGRVADLEGRPLERAEVAIEPVAAGAGTAVVVPTDVAGGFVLPPVEPGRYSLSVEKEGRVAAVVPGLVAPAEARPWDVGEVRLAPGGILRGRLVDGAGVAISPARIVARFPEADPGAAQAGRPRLVSADGDGDFELGGLPARGRLDLEVTAPGFEPAVRTVALPALEPLEIVLVAGELLAGEVVDEAGDPVPGALVEVVTAEDSQAGERPAAESEPAPPPRVTTADAAGAFRFTGLAAGRLEVSANAPGLRLAEPLVVELGAGEELWDLRIELVEGLTVRGTVSGHDGPLADATVDLTRVPGPSPAAASARPAAAAAARAERRRASTGDDGDFVLDGLAPGDWTLVAHHRGYRPLRRTLSLSGEPAPLDLRLDPGAEIRGVVIAPDGRPLSGAEVTLTPIRAAAPDGAAATPRFAPAPVRSDAAGRFRHRGLEAGRYRLAARAAGWAPRQPPLEVEIGDAGVDGLEIELQPATAIAGRIAGLPLDELAAAEVVAYCPPESTARARPDFAGRFRLADLEPCAWRVAVRAGEVTAQRQVETSPGALGAWVELDMELDGDVDPDPSPDRGDVPDPESKAAGRDRASDL